MDATLLRLARRVDEEPGDYARRRRRITRVHVQQGCLLCSFLFKHVISWDEHLASQRNIVSWANRVKHFHGKTWMPGRRSNAKRGGARSKRGLCTERSGHGMGTSSKRSLVIYFNQNHEDSIFLGDLQFLPRHILKYFQRHMLA